MRAKRAADRSPRLNVEPAQARGIPRSGNTRSIPPNAVAQLASLHEAEAQLAADHEAAAQDAVLQEALAQEASDLALLAQLAASKASAPVLGSLTRKALSARFGFGGFCASIERAALISPTPSERSAAFGIGFVPTISAPLT